MQPLHKVINSKIQSRLDIILKSFFCLKEHEANPQANPSNDDPTAEDKVENAHMDRGTNDNVETNTDQTKDEDAAPFVSVM